MELIMEMSEFRKFGTNSVKNENNSVERGAKLLKLITIHSCFHIPITEWDELIEPLI